MYVVNSLTGEKIKVSISKIETNEIARINKAKLFDFNWNKEKSYSVYILRGANIDSPIGLLSIAERASDFAIEIRLIAAAKEHIGSKGKYRRIAGCLIAFACNKAFQAGYDGYVCLKPKTELTNHYITKYGFKSTNLYLITEGKNSLELIREYYAD